MSFVLKVVHDTKAGHYFSDDRHRLGGTCLKQIWAFNHLFPSGYLNWGLRDLLWEMADLHGWRVEVTEVEKWHKAARLLGLEEHVLDSSGGDQP